MRRRRARRLEPLPSDLLEALERAWEERGAQAIATLREYDPGGYMRLMARLCLARRH
jgi:hypothetical protein